MESRHISSRSIGGGIVLLVGLLLLLETTGTADTAQLWRYFPTVFVLVALWAMVASDFRNVTGPLVVLVLAATWQLFALDLVTEAFVATWWPLLVIAIGLAVLFGRRFRRPVSAIDSERIDVFSVFGGVERRVTSPAFQAADVTSAFGGVDLDLRDAVVPEKPATVNVFQAFGGTEIRVPEDWVVRMTVVPLFGGAEDERPQTGRTVDEPDLVVTGVVGFGAVSVKD